MTTNLTQTAFNDLQDLADVRLMEADTDALTGLMNRRGLDRRTRGRDWGFFVVADLNNFKASQDAHADGHLYGDQMLVAFSDFLLSNTRQRDMRARDLIAARTGGDEFALWCETRAGAERIKEAIRAWRSDDQQVTASVGMGRDLKAADAAMYLHKTNG